MQIVQRTSLLSLALCAAAVAAQPTTDPAHPAPRPPAAPATNAPETKKEPTAQERLAASEKLYAEAKNYRDEGKLTFEVTSGAKVITDNKTFTTAFVRDGGFRWEIFHSMMPGGEADKRFIVWSSDGRTYKSYWSLTQERDEQSGMTKALTRATTVSGGASAAIIPLLSIAQPDPALGVKSTDILNPVDKGKEAVDGVDCWKIEGTAKTGGAKVTLWLDAAGLIHKIYTETVVEAEAQPRDAKKGATPGFTSRVTITLKPFINEAQFDAARLAANEADGSQPRR